MKEGDLEDDPVGGRIAVSVAKNCLKNSLAKHYGKGAIALTPDGLTLEGDLLGTWERAVAGPGPEICLIQIVSTNPRPALSGRGFFVSIPKPIEGIRVMQTTIDPIAADKVTLYFRKGGSDKVYHAAIEPAGAGLFVVNFAYGRRGSTMNAGTKTQVPVSYDKARAIYEKLIRSKTAKGYTPGADGTPYVGGDREARATGIACQLLNPIDEADLADYLDNPLYVAQEKFDGRRLLVRKADGQVSGINRQGLEVGLPATIAESAAQLPGEFVIDGEAVGDTLYAFDLLELDLVDLRSEPYWLRLGTLERLLTTQAGGAILIVSTASTSTEKRALMDRLRTESREGIVFKNKDAPYTANRPASGGSQLKFKFYETASCLVAGVNEKRSVGLVLKDGPRLVACGNVAIPPSHDIPSPGQVVELRYLYAMPGSNALFQPVYLGPRDDIPAHDCTIAQLKYKAA